MKNGIGKRVSLFLLPVICAWLIRAWFATCRIRVHGYENRQLAEKSGRPIVGTCWHFCVLGIFVFFKKESPVLMISSSNDGDYLTRMAQYLGFTVVRGSRNKKGMQAARELIKELRKGKIVGLVADGSQGPARRAQPGSVLMASRAEGSILPMLYSATRYFCFNSWDRLILPKLFSRIDIFYGEPLVVPSGIKSAEIEEYRCILEERMNLLYDKVWQLQGKDEH